MNDMDVLLEKSLKIYTEIIALSFGVDIENLPNPEYSKRLAIGQKIFGIIGDELNVISDKFIRTQGTDFRDEASFFEICVALSLLLELLSSNVATDVLKRFED